MNSSALKEQLAKGAYDEALLAIYADDKEVTRQRVRYLAALDGFEKRFGERDAEVFSAPGRSELGGNHTDHQHGEVLAASIHLDALGIAGKSEDGTVTIVSDQYEDILVDIEDLTMSKEEMGTSAALVKGVLCGLQKEGYRIGGFCAYVTSDVLIGSGLSSSAAYETLIGTIISGLYNNMSVDPMAIAAIGQYAENVYFGKPCGRMDQMACSVGGLVHIDFRDTKHPKLENVSVDLNRYGYSLCITDTKGSHADLTDDYAAVPKEMNAVAACFGKEYLIDVTMQDLLNDISRIRTVCGDRAVLRAFHFLTENARVKKEVIALKEEDMEAFLSLVKESGDSSYKYLQNVYSGRDVTNQNVALALALSDGYLGGNGVSRVHGGGFAGTIQAFVKNDAVEGYQRHMNAVFGEGACIILRIRKYGGVKVIGEIVNVLDKRGQIVGGR